MAKHRLYEETVDRSVYATDRGVFRNGETGRPVGRVFRRVEVGDYWELDSDARLRDWERMLLGMADRELKALSDLGLHAAAAEVKLAAWEVELVEAAAAARRERGL